MLLKAGRTSFVATAIGFAVATAAALIALRTSTTPAALIQAHMVGLSYLVAGAIAWRRRPGNATGPLLVAIGSTWYVVDFKALPMPAAAALAFATRRIVNFLSTYLMLAYPARVGAALAADRARSAGHVSPAAARSVTACGLDALIAVGRPWACFRWYRGGVYADNHSSASGRAQEAAERSADSPPPGTSAPLSAS